MWRTASCRSAVLLGLLVVVLAIPQYLLPVQYNEAMFAVIGRGLLRGQLPYRDYFDQKPPLIFAIYALAQWVSGHDVLAARVAITTSLALSAVLVDRIARSFYTRFRFLAAGAFALTTVLLPLTLNAQLDELALLPILIATNGTLSVRMSGSRRAATVVGLAAGLALLLKPTLFPVVAALSMLLLQSSRRQGPLPLLLMGGGIAAVAASTIAMLASLGIADEAVQAVILFGRAYSAYGWTHQEQPRQLVLMLFFLAPLAFGSATSALLLIRRRDSRLLPLGTLVLAGALCVILPGFMLLYYVWAVVPFLALMVPALFESLANHRLLSRFAAGALLFPAVMALLASLAFFPLAMRSEQEAERIGAAIRTRSGPDDEVWVRANLPEIYVFSGLLPSTRYFTPQARVVWPAVEEEELDRARRQPPRFIVVARSDWSPGLSELLAASYHAIVSEAGYLAYERRDGAVTPPGSGALQR
jgi:4-amino-4-deoxy-L-arabinose transferase-like glycosyltransferase